MLTITVSCNLGYLLQGSRCNKHGRCLQNLQGGLKCILPRCCVLNMPFYPWSTCHHAETVQRKYWWEWGGNSGFYITSRLFPAPAPHPLGHQWNSPINQPRKHYGICQHTNTHNKQIKCQEILSWLDQETCELPVRNARQHPTLPSHCSRQIPSWKVSKTTDPSETGALWKWFRYVSHNLLTKYPSSAMFDTATPNNPRYLLSQES